ncbi:hypothetical protein N008_20085 [Hymenobacter sp. APR13]|nr:hypothetical protein N008_20085 [Hymenobacter sp. APR13]
MSQKMQVLFNLSHLRKKVCGKYPGLSQKAKNAGRARWDSIRTHRDKISHLKRETYNNRFF